MGRLKIRGGLGAIGRFSILMALTVLVGGCFQPLYGERGVTGGSAVREALRGVEVDQIAAPAGSFEAGLATQLRNELLFAFTGGGSSTTPRYQLKVMFSGGSGSVSVNNQAGLPTVEMYSVTASYTLVEKATNKSVVVGKVSSFSQYNPPGTQRFARISASQAAGRNITQDVANQIAGRLASYFVAGQ